MYKSGNGYKKIAAQLKMPISTVRAIIKKLMKFKSVINQPRTGCKAILSVRRTVREVQTNLQRPQFQNYKVW